MGSKTVTDENESSETAAVGEAIVDGVAAGVMASALSSGR